jgi:spore coat protein I
MQGMDREAAESYGLEIRNMVPYKDAFMAVTSQGRKIIRKMPFSPERLKFIHGAKEHLIYNGFTGVDKYLCTVTGEPYFISENSCYTMVDFIDGRESSFDEDSDVKQASFVLAKLHGASRGYRVPEGCKVQSDLGKLPEYFTKRLEDIKKMKKQARRGKGHFDQLFLEHADHFCETGESAVAALKSSGYARLVEDTREEGLFCHHDYTHHNIIMEGDRTVVINFDYSCFELRIYDIANLIRRKMRKCDWDISKTELIINSYSSIEMLDKEELAVMKIILQFPQKFWRVVNRYYNSRRSWSERSFVIRLQEVIDEIGPHKEFLKNYQNIF